MFCSSCGKEISNESNFCMYCGKQVNAGVAPAQQTAVQWEYKDYVREWEIGKGGKVAMNVGNTAVAQVEIWTQIQSWVLPQLQEEFDKGWEAITDVGPTAIELQENDNFFATGYGIKSIRIKLRRDKSLHRKINVPNSSERERRNMFFRGEDPGTSSPKGKWGD